MRTYKWSSFQGQQKYTDSWRDYISGNKPGGYGWYGLVKEYYDKQLLTEGITRDPLDDPELLNELFGKKRGWEAEAERQAQEDAGTAPAAAPEGGDQYKATWWEKAKGVMAKMGTLEKSGKFLPGAKGKAYADAKERLAKAAANAAEHLINRNLNNIMAQKYPKFPNMTTNEEFRDALLDIGTIYDSVVASTQKDPQDEEYIDAVSANYIIAYLREFVQYNLDNELKDAYKHFKENQELEEAAPPFGGVAAVPTTPTPTRQGGKVAQPGSGQAGYAAPEGPEGKYTQRAAKKGSYSAASTTIQGLKSNTLPTILGLLGAAAGGAAGYVAMTTNTPLIQPEATDEEIWKTVSQSVETNVSLAADPNGTLAMFANGAGDPQNFQDIAGNIDKIAAAGGITPDEVIATYSDVAMMGDESEVALKAVYEWGKQGGDISAWGAGGGVPTAEFQEFVTANPAFKDIHGYVSQTGFGAGTGVASDVAGMAGGGFGNTWGDLANAVEKFSPEQTQQMADTANELAKGLGANRDLFTPETIQQMIANAKTGGHLDVNILTGDAPQAVSDLSEPAGLAHVLGVGANSAMGGEAGASGMERLLGLNAETVMSVGSTVSTITFKVFMGMGTRAAAAAAGAGAAGALGIGAAAAPILGLLGIAGITAGVAVKLIRMKGLKSSRAQMFADLMDEMQDVSVPPTPVPVKPPEPINGTGPGPTDPEPEPGPGTPEVIEVPKPVLIRYDKDDFKVYAPPIRSQAKAEKYIELMKKLQKQGLMGRTTVSEAFEKLEAQLLKELTDEEGTDESERGLGTRGFRWPEGTALTMQALQRKYGRKRKNRRTGVVRKPILQVFHVIDMSIIDDLVGLNVDKNQARMLVRSIIKQLAQKEKAQLAPVSVKGILRAMAKVAPSIANTQDEILGVLSAYKLVRAKASATAQKPAQKPVGPVAQPTAMAAQEGLKRTRKTLQESKRRSLQEAKQNEAWGTLTNRWKELSGIK